jgi:two-component system sensor histidine kinase EvgS
MSLAPTQDSASISPAVMRRTAWLLAGAILPFLAVWLVPAGLTFAGATSYAPLHTFMEMFAIVIAMLIFGVAWNAYSSERPGNLLILAGGFLAVGLIALADMLAWAGMPSFVAPGGHGEPTNFQLAARLLTAVTLLAIALRQWQPVASLAARYLLLATSIAVTGLVYWVGLYHADLFPRTLAGAKGLTALQAAVPSFIIAALVASGWFLLQDARRRGSFSTLCLFAACMLYVLGELCFAQYSDPGDRFDMLGHVYKIAAYAMVYRAVFVHAVRSPFERLSRARAELERANEEIRRVNAGLEHRVAERTASLDQANASLRDGAARIQSILDTVAEGIFSIDAHGVVETFNRAAERIFGYPAVEVIGHDVKMLMHEAHHALHGRVLDDFRATGQASVTGRPTEVLAARKDGSIFPMEISVSHMRLHGEGHFTVIGRDITERKSANDQLSKLSLAVEQSPESIVITDLEGRIEYVNEGFVHATGYNREDVIGRNPRLLQSGGTPPETYVALWNALSQGRPWKGEFHNRRKDGSEYVEFASVTPLYQPDGSISHYVAVKEDITERKRIRIELDRHQQHLEELVESRTVELSTARREAEAANHAKSSFLATMSHEIRTPLSGMMGMLELLSMSPLSDEQHETLQMARDSARGLLRILNDVLEWSKIEEGKLELAPQPTSIAALLNEVANNYAPVASGKSVILMHQVDVHLSQAFMVDGLRLSQVLNNFVSNAIKFSHEGGRVELRAELIARREGVEDIRCSVKDTGIGIDIEAQSRLFQSYGQASADTARMYGGTGLGLAICRRLADLMGGRIDVASEPGRGSTFSITLTLPLAKTTVEPRQGRVTVAAPFAWPLVDGAVSAEAPRVLVVDDHPTNRKLLARQLALFGLRVEVASDGREALPLWRDGRYAMVITDCHMPQLDGYELTYAIRGIEADQARPRTPIFAWTANALADEAEKCGAAGMDELLIKPTDLGQLQRLLEKWLPTVARAVPDRPEASAAPRADAAPPPLDLSTLTIMCGEGSAAVRENLLAFRRVNDQDAVQLRQAVAQDDLERVVHASHRMLGSSGIVGAHDLAGACRSVNHAGRAGDSETVAEGMQALEREVQRLNAYIDSLAHVSQGVPDALQ